MTAGQVFAVLTGDIVESSQLNGGQGYPISNIIDKINSRVFSYFRSSIYQDIDVFRGDSWQMVVMDASQSLRIALLLRALLRSEKSIEPTDTRVSIGFGRIDYLPEKDISSGNGEAFRLSGSGLDQCRKSQQMILSFPLANRSSLTEGLNILIKFIDFQTQRWTAKQSDAIAGALVGLTQREIASEWIQKGITQQAVSQHLDNAGWNTINSSIRYFEAILPEILYI
ncbi:MAG: hypothetical protein KAH12_09850 [Anaerolineales bacterium]|nr:hypothetical protein [Anaerolineales bacterium]